jgi:F-type H+-transporting ATPase subunit b
MAQNTETNKSSGVLNYVVGLILLIVGAVVLRASNVTLPGDIQLNLGTLLSTIGVVLILFPVVQQFYIQPLEIAINDRNGNLERTFTEAEDLRNRMDTMRSDYEKKLVETEADARAKIQAQIKEAQALRQRLEAEAVGRADDLIKRAHDEIAAERDKVLTELRIETVNLTISATEKLLGENMDSAKNRRLVEDFINKVEVPS